MEWSCKDFEIAHCGLEVSGLQPVQKIQADGQFLL